MKARWLVVIAAMVVAVAAGLFAVSSAPASTPAAGFDITHLDLHDGTMLEYNGTYYLYGEMYGCGFTWTQQNTPWCGFGVSSSPDRVTWSKPQPLFLPSEIDVTDNMPWSQVCGGTGADCYAPRMIQRSGWGYNDGTFILWFDAPYDWNVNHASNSYYAMGCNGPMGPCGYNEDNETKPRTSVNKPVMKYCGGNADLDIVTPPGGAEPVALCTNADQTVSEDELDVWGTNANGDGTGSSDLAGLTGVEGLGAYLDTASNTWIMTYSDPNCKFCAGTATGYATAPSLLGPWTAPDNPPAQRPASGRRDLNPTSCGGQPDTVVTLDGTPYEMIDIWSGALNEASASLHFEPLAYHPGNTALGALWQPFDVWQCQ